MPATFSSLSPRQQSYIASLAAERGLTNDPAVRAAASGELPGRNASDLIDQLLATPRTVNRAQGGTVVPTPSDTTRAGRMLAAGGIEATVTLDDGRHITVNIRTRKRSGRGWTNGAPGDEGSRTNVSVFGNRVGWINVEGGEWKLTLRTRNAASIEAVNAVLTYAAGQPTAVRVQEASRCGRCLRPLTDPVSIDRGVGPECFGRETGSRAANVHTVDATTSNVITTGTAATTNAANVHVTITRQPLEGGQQQTLTDLAAVAASPVLSSDQQRARDLIAEALDCRDLPAAHQRDAHLRPAGGAKSRSASEPHRPAVRDGLRPDARGSGVRAGQLHLQAGARHGQGGARPADRRHLRRRRGRRSAASRGSSDQPRRRLAFAPRPGGSACSRRAAPLLAGPHPMLVGDHP